MQKRLVTFGCSFTYGQGLPDCLDIETDGPSQMGWPALLAKKLDRELVNNSSPGSSNLEILHQILNFEFLEDDIAVVMWTVFDRDTIFHKADKPSESYLEKVGAWSKFKLAKKMFRNMELSDQAVKSWIYIHHADLIFKSKNIEYVHYTAIAGHLEPYKPKFIEVDNMHDIGLFWLDRTEDNHPGIESNKVTADKIYEILCK